VSMLTDLDAVMRWITSSLFTGSVQGAVVIAAIWIVIRRFAGTPPWLQAAIWWLAALKLVAAFLPIPTLSIPVLPAGTLLPALHAQREAGSPSQVSSAGGLSASAWAAAETAGQPDNARIARWVAALVALWAAGLLFRNVRRLRALRILRGVLRRSMPADAEDTAVVRQLSDIVGLSKAPDVRVSTEIDSLLVTRARRPVILVPFAGERAFTPDERAMALCHELVHVRRRDLSLGWVPALAEDLFFFHPLVRLATREYLTAREAACDAAVVRALGVPAAEYGHLLVRIGVAAPVSSFAAGGASPSRSSLIRRLKMLQSNEPTTVSRRVLWSIVALLVTAMMPFQLVAQTPSAPVLTLPAAASVPVEIDQLALLQPAPIAPVTGGPSQPAGDRAAINQAIDELKKTLAEQESSMRDSLVKASPDVERLRAERAEMLRRMSERLRAAAQEVRQGARRNQEQLESAQALRESQELLLRERVKLHERLRQLVLEQEALLRDNENRRRELQQRLEAVRRELESQVIGPAADGLLRWQRSPDSTRNEIVIANAGDSVRVSKDGVLVNGVRVAGLSPAFLAGLPDQPWEQIVPANYRFVMFEEREGEHVSRFWGLIPVVRTRTPQ
jgi:beta-lactamase regulating signal transducer with metallopeptidase domain/cell division septum initiation protein DivIVA